MVSITYSGCRATSFSPPPSKLRPMTSAPAARWNRHRSCEATRRRTTLPNPGKASGASDPHRSNRAGARYPLRRHQHHERIGRAYLRHALLRAWAKGKSDQIAQDPAGVGWNFLSCAARQSDATHPHTAAYWLMLDLRDNIPKTHALAVAEFATLREKLLKIGARVVETARRIRLALGTACPHAALFWHLAGALQPAGPERRGRDNVRAPHSPIPATPTRSKRT